MALHASAAGEGVGAEHRPRSGTAPARTLSLLVSAPAETTGPAPSLAEVRRGRGAPGRIGNTADASRARDPPAPKTRRTPLAPRRRLPRRRHAKGGARRARKASAGTSQFVGSTGWCVVPSGVVVAATSDSGSRVTRAKSVSSPSSPFSFSFATILARQALVRRVQDRSSRRRGAFSAPSFSLLFQSSASSSRLSTNAQMTSTPRRPDDEPARTRPNASSARVTRRLRLEATPARGARGFRAIGRRACSVFVVGCARRSPHMAKLVARRRHDARSPFAWISEDEQTCLARRGAAPGEPRIQFERGHVDGGGRRSSARRRGPASISRRVVLRIRIAFLAIAGGLDQRGEVVLAGTFAVARASADGLEQQTIYPHRIPRAGGVTAKIGLEGAASATFWCASRTRAS